MRMLALGKGKPVFSSVIFPVNVDFVCADICTISSIANKINNNLFIFMIIKLKSNLL